MVETRLKNSFKTLPCDGNSCRTFLISAPPSRAHLCSKMCETCEIYGNFIALDILQNVERVTISFYLHIRVMVNAVANENIKGCVNSLVTNKLSSISTQILILSIILLKS